MVPRGVLRRIVLLLLALAVVAEASAATDSDGDREGAPRPDVGTDAPPEPRTRVAPFLTFGAQLEVEYLFARNLDLTDATRDDVSLLAPELQLALSFDPSPRVQVFVNLELSQELALTAPQPEERRLSIGLKEAFLHVKALAPGGLALQVGRQSFKDDREWLYDEELDAVRAFWRPAGLELQVSVSRLGLFRTDFFDHDSTGQTNNYLVYGRYRFGPAVTPAAYVFVCDDRSPARERPVFVGLQAGGALGEALTYWLELAHVRGRDGSRPIRGWGVDAGITYAVDLPLRPSVTAAYAVGSGDSHPDGRTDGAFRQTGLQENEARWAGVTRFKYYGELLDPELSNLAIVTVGLGLRPTRQSSVDLVYHEYRQQTASTALRGAVLAADPSGLSRQLGRELDLIVGYGGVKGLEVTGVLGYFIPGRAFPRADGSGFARVKVEWKW
jgi:alginate production protein